MTEPHRPWEVCGTSGQTPEMEAALARLAKHMIPVDPADRPFTARYPEDLSGAT
jgi:hypothetical protein